MADSRFPYSDRIHTTHVGSLPRPQPLIDIMQAKAKGEPYDPAALARLLTDSTRDVVAAQVAAGIDVVSDGEFSKPSYATYVGERLTGFGGTFKGWTPGDLRDFRDYALYLIDTKQIVPEAGGGCCEGPVAVKDRRPLEEDLANFRAAVDAARPKGAFMSAASPGVIAQFQRNTYYPTEDAYIEAVADVMRLEFEAIVAAGFQVQVDSPDLAMGRHFAYSKESDESFLVAMGRNIEALNHATRNIAPERMRMHVCWGNYEGPHHRDIPLEKIVHSVLKARPAYLSLEGANPRHEHEWAVFESVRLPEGKVLIPGVIDSTSNYVEHPQVVKQRILRYAGVVGRERVMAGADCGFATFSGYPNVFPSIAWKKIESLVEGARLATQALWS
ncbi:MAG: cobalamin-independent methionine synthase II family protein [Gammaproteobacteria bacterium]